MACRDKLETLRKEREKKQEGEGRCEVGMVKKKGVVKKKRNAHCTFQMDGK